MIEHKGNKEMREILFRGKANTEGRDNEWVYGGLLPETQNTFPIIVRDYDNDEDWIGVNGWDTVAPETVGQFTGLTDKNGKKIFEGDIVRYTRTNMYAPNCSFHKQDLVSIHLVLWDSSVSAFVQRHYELNGKRILGKGGAVLYDERAKENIVEIIGNIHDNPELLK